MKVSIALASSMSSQLGLLTYFKFIENRKEKLKSFDGARNFLLILPPENSRKDLLFINALKETYFYKQKTKIFFIKSRLFKVFIFLTIKFTSFFVKDVTIIEPRPGWHSSLVGESLIKKLKLINFDKYKFFKKKLLVNYQYYGDGFSLYCAEGMPFWLVSKKNKIAGPSYLIPTCSEFYFTYDVSLNADLDHSTKMPLKFTRSVVDIAYAIERRSKYYDTIVTEMISCKRSDKLLIFTGTTFSKTGRSTINDEVSLYIEYIIEVTKGHSEEFDLIYKPHPGSTKIFNDIFRKRLRLLVNINLIDLNDHSSLPLELLIKLVSELYSEESIYVTGLSSGSVFAATLFPNTTVKFGFGESLVKKYIFEDFIQGRLNQEKSLFNSLSIFKD